MTKVNCESISIAAMAMADGYQSELSREQIEAHLASCSGCRREVAQLEAVSDLLHAQQRRTRTDDIWQLVERRLPEVRPAPFNRFFIVHPSSLT